MTAVNLNTFSNDYIFREKSGKPIGRIVLFDETEYSIGVSTLKVAILKVPLTYSSGIIGLEGYIDGIKYKIPTSIHDIKVNRRDKDWVLTNFFLKRV